MVTINKLFEGYEAAVEDAVVCGYHVMVSKRLTCTEYAAFVDTMVEYMVNAHRDNAFLPFRMMLRLFTIHFYTNLEIDDDTHPDHLLKLVYESDLYEKIVGANGEPALINLTQYNDMLADISYTLRQRWDAENSARMARIMGYTEERGAE